MTPATFCPPLRDPVTAAPKLTATIGFKADSFSRTEAAVAERFVSSLAGARAISGRFVDGEYVLHVAIGNHQQDVRDRSLITALSLVARLHADLTPTEHKEAA